VYGVGAVILGVGFLVLAYQLRRKVTDPEADPSARAMRLFHGSITYLALLFLLVALEPFVP